MRPSRGPGVSTITGAPGVAAGADHRAAGRRGRSALAEAGVAVGAGAGRVARVVGVQEVEPAGDRERALDRVARAPRRRRARGRCRSRSRARPGRRRPPSASQSRASASKRRATAFSPPAVFSISTGTSDSSISSVRGQRPTPSAIPSSAWPAWTITAVGADRGRRVAGLLEDLARAVADVRLRRADVDQVGRVDVDADRRSRGARPASGCGRRLLVRAAGSRGRSARSRRRARRRPRAELARRHALRSGPGQPSAQDQRGPTFRAASAGATLLRWPSAY